MEIIRNKSFIMSRLLIFLLAVATSLSVAAYDFAVKNSNGQEIYYRLVSPEKNTVEVTNNGYGCYEGNLDIPAFVEYGGKNYTVIGVGIKALRDCNKLESVILPATATYINYKAFKDCENLFEIILPSSIQYIGYQCFGSCEKLHYIYIAVKDPATIQWEDGGTNKPSFYINPECTIVVPKGSENLYKRTSPWNQYKIEGRWMPN